MSWPVSSMASSKSAWMNRMPLIFGPVLLQSGNCFSAAGLLRQIHTVVAISHSGWIIC